jgi:uncharacterized protein DUF5309
MAIPASAPFASFDLAANTYVADISSFLDEALKLNTNFLGSINTSPGFEATQPTHLWNMDVLNPTFVVAQTTTGTSITVTAAEANLVKPGYQLIDPSGGAAQVTAVSGTTITVTTNFGGTTSSWTTSDKLKINPALQEASDITVDATPNFAVFSNFTQILEPGNILISRTQLEREMVAVNDFLAHNIANRTLEMQQLMTNAFLYGVKGSDAGSDTTIRTLDGLARFIINNGGDRRTSFGQLTYDTLNTVNTALVNKGQYVDTLLVSPTLMPAVANMDVSHRRLAESERVVGFTVEEILLAQGNAVKVISDGRVNSTDFFLYKGDDIRGVPFKNSAFILKAAEDFVDGKKRRILGEWTLEVHRPAGMSYVSGATP